MAAEEGGGGLTQRELLLEVRADVKAMRMALDTKADLRAVEALDDRVNNLGLQLVSTNDRVTKVEGRVTTTEEVAKSKTALISVVVALIVMLAAVGGLLLRIGGS